jgi:vacuolar-type H+-ATPase subunit H
MGYRPVTVLISVLIFVFTAIVLPVVLGEAVDWLPWVATRLLRRAACHLPLEYRARYVAEWKGEFYVLPGGKLTKLFFALRVYKNARLTGAKLREKLAARDMVTAARVLALAQQTADQAIADARREADETLGWARREAEEVLDKARRQANQIRAKATRRGRTAS